MSRVHTVNVLQVVEGDNNAITLRLTPGSFGRTDQEDVPESFMIFTYKQHAALVRRMGDARAYSIEAVSGDAQTLAITLAYHSQRNLPLVWTHIWAEG